MPGRQPRFETSPIRPYGTPQTRVLRFLGRSAYDRGMSSGGSQTGGYAIATVRNLPRWEIHRVVWAARIFSIIDARQLNTDCGLVTVPDGWRQKYRGPGIWRRIFDRLRHRSTQFGYVIFWEDGSVTWASREDFEDGFRRIE